MKVSNMLKKNLKIIWFIEDSNPTEEDIEGAEALAGYNVVFRNGSFVADEDKPEICDGVAGFTNLLIKKVYGEIPTAEKAIATFEKTKAERKKAAIATFEKPVQKKVEKVEPVQPEIKKKPAVWTPNA